MSTSLLNETQYDKDLSERTYESYSKMIYYNSAPPEGIPPNYCKYIDNYNPKSTNNKYNCEFIGSLPVTLEYSDLPKLVGQPYNVTLKADGERFLMFIGETVIEEEAKGYRDITFISRSSPLNKGIYQVKGPKNQLLPPIRTNKMLIDGEMIKNTDGTMEFMIFDLLYYEGNSSMNIPFDDAIVSRGGGLPGNKPLDGRYSILKNDIMPVLTAYILNKPIGKTAIRFNPRGPWRNTQYSERVYDSDKTNSWFNFSLKKFLHVKDLNVHTSSSLYNYIKKQPSRELTTGTKNLKVSSDGLIFTNFTFPYIMGTNYFQYKWKPPEQLTIDVRPTRNSTGGYKLLVGKGYNNEEPLKNAIYRGELPPSCKEGNIAEFNFSQGKWQFYKCRPDKKRPNALSTVKNVIRSIEHPVQVDLLKDLLKFKTKEIPFNDTKTVKNKLTATSERFKKLLNETRDKNGLEKCVFHKLGPKVGLVDRSTTQVVYHILDIRKQWEERYKLVPELELRLGNYSSGKFNANIPKFLAQFLEISLLSHPIEATVDAIDNTAVNLDSLGECTLRTTYYCDIKDPDFKKISLFCGLSKSFFIYLPIK